MKTVVTVHTGVFMVGLIKNLFTGILPNTKLINIVDDGIIAEAVKADGVTPALPKG